MRRLYNGSYVATPRNVIYVRNVHCYSWMSLPLNGLRISNGFASMHFVAVSEPRASGSTDRRRRRSVYSASEGRRSPLQLTATGCTGLVGRPLCACTINAANRSQYIVEWRATKIVTRDIYDRDDERCLPQPHTHLLYLLSPPPHS